MQNWLGTTFSRPGSRSEVRYPSRAGGKAFRRCCSCSQSAGPTSHLLPISLPLKSRHTISDHSQIPIPVPVQRVDTGETIPTQCSRSPPAQVCSAVPSQSNDTLRNGHPAHRRNRCKVLASRTDHYSLREGLASRNGHQPNHQD